MVKTSVRALLSLAVTGREQAVNGKESADYLSTVEHGRVGNWGGGPAPHRSEVWEEYCSFWIEDDGWNGFSEELSVTVRGTSFEEAKTKMEEALREQIDLAEWHGWMVLASRSAGGSLHRIAGVIQGLTPECILLTFPRKC